MSDTTSPDVILLYRARSGRPLAGGSYVAQLPSGRLQAVEVQSPIIAPSDRVWYSTNPVDGVYPPCDCPTCGEPMLCDCADDLCDDMEHARRVAEQLSGVLDVIQQIHSVGCDPDSGSLICGTCRVSYPCDTIAATQALEEPAARLHWAGEWP